MSLVGTRPPTLDEWVKYELHHRTRMAIKPGMPWLLYNLFTVLFDRSQFPVYFRTLIKYVVVVFISCLLCYGVCYFVTFGNWTTLIIRAVMALYCATTPVITVENMECSSIW